MGSEMNREHIQDDVQSTVGVQVKVADEAQGPLP